MLAVTTVDQILSFITALVIIFGAFAAFKFRKWVREASEIKKRSFELNERAQSLLCEVRAKRERSWGSSLAAEKNGVTK
jgi:NifB/MoaA-like Fe-S oxidoreductase